jgi:hypothetical protein
VREVPQPAPRRKNKTISAKTPSREKAEQQAHEIRESWDTVKQKLRELDEFKQAQEGQEIPQLLREDALACSTWRLLSGRYEKVIAATFECDKRPRRPSDQFGDEIRATSEAPSRLALSSDFATSEAVPSLAGRAGRDGLGDSRPRPFLLL